jgi:Predicted aminopeptidases
MKQPDEKLRALNMQPTTPGPREMVFCTKVGTTHPDEMYIVGGHMDGHGWGEAANDDGSGTALVMELARVFSAPDVKTERTIRFALWNNEETGSQAARAYIAQRRRCRARRTRGIGQVPGAEVARHDPARHHAVRSRHAAARRDDAQGTARRGRRQHRVPVELEDGGREPEAGLGVLRGQRKIRDRLSGRGRRT